MIILSKAHKEEVSKILLNYNDSDYEKVLLLMEPILKEYYPLNPKTISKRLLHGLFKAWLNKGNEVIVHYWVICKLINEYQYPSEYIELEVACGNIGRANIKEIISRDTSCDIVVYTHSSRRTGSSLVAIECREYKGVNGLKQAASYARALGANYHLFTDSDLWQSFETQPHPIDGIPISDIPHWVGFKPLNSRLSKNFKLPPITDEKLLTELVKISHDSIHKEGVDPATAFDELIKLFFVKLYDEQEIPGVYEFSILSGESADDTGKHIRELLKEARKKSKYKELFTEPGDDEFYINNKSIRKVVETFQGFSFIGGSLIGIDVKGTVYEKMVGSTFRGELGQYFTPRKIVEFIVDLLEPTKEDKVLDPACGSGGFLIYVLRKIAVKIRNEQSNLPLHNQEILIKEFANHNIFGADLSPRMVRAARMNMIMHGDGWAGIQRCHGLNIDENFISAKEGYDLILSNPPFAGFESDFNILSKFEIGFNEQNNIRGVNRALVFV
ncbi:MAG: N-6 DNA methylase, partial [Actinobacteria bacterium]|nr:N-6 DNA methylase [Actinomycetota bacterium]